MLIQKAGFNFKPGDKLHISQSLTWLGSQIQNTDTIREQFQLLQPEDCVIKPDVDVETVFNGTNSEVLKELFHGIGENIRDTEKNFLIINASLSNKTDTESIQAMKENNAILFSLEKEISAAFYKMYYGDEKCTMLNCTLNKYTKDLLKWSKNCEQTKERLFSNYENKGVEI